LLAPLTAVTDRVWPSSSVSLATRVAAVMVALTSSAVVAVSSTATGASAWPPTVTVTVAASVAEPSLTV
jgi:hypothetical protein